MSSSLGKVTRRHVVRMTPTGGAGTDLTSDLPWREAQGTLGALRKLFVHPDARAEGWTATPVAHGFVAFKGGVSVTFWVTDVVATDLVGRSRDLLVRAPDLTGSER